MNKIKGGKLLLFAAAGFGPNLMMSLVTAYLNDALLGEVANPVYSFTGSCIVSVLLCSVLFMVAKIIDGVIDVPLAYLSDRLKCKFGKRRLSILLGWAPMVASYFLLWLIPSFTGGNAAANTWLETVCLIVFYSSYTMCLVSYYGCFAHITGDTQDRLKLSNYKSFFDTIQYCVAYALFPIILGALSGGETGGIVRTMLLMAPVLVTMLIPVFMIKEEGFSEQVDEKVPLLKSIRIAFSSKPFLGWMVTLFALHMGLMLFLTGIGTTIPQNLLGLDSGWKITVMNASAFAPVPIMLYFYNKLAKKRSIRYAFQSALLVFAAGMFVCAAGWNVLWGNWLISFLIGITAGVICSYSIGAFFTSSYIFASQIAATELETSKRDHSAMYFAVQGLVTQVASAIGVSLIYMNLVSSDIPMFGTTDGGIFIVPVIAGICCLAAYGLSFLMEKGYVYKAKKE